MRSLFVCSRNLKMKIEFIVSLKEKFAKPKEGLLLLSTYRASSKLKNIRTETGLGQSPKAQAQHWAHCKYPKHPEKQGPNFSKSWTKPQQTILKNQ